MNLVQYKMSICSHKRYVNKNLIFLDFATTYCSYRTVYIHFATTYIAATVQYTHISSTVNPVSIVSPDGRCRLTCCKICDRLYGLISTLLNFPTLVTSSDSCIRVMLNFNSNMDISVRNRRRRVLFRCGYLRHTFINTARNKWNAGANM